MRQVLSMKELLCYIRPYSAEVLFCGSRCDMLSSLEHLILVSLVSLCLNVWHYSLFVLHCWLVPSLQHHVFFQLSLDSTLCRCDVFQCVVVIVHKMGMVWVDSPHNWEHIACLPICHHSGLLFIWSVIKTTVIIQLNHLRIWSVVIYPNKLAWTSVSFLSCKLTYVMVDLCWQDVHNLL